MIDFYQVSFSAIQVYFHQYMIYIGSLTKYGFMYALQFMYIKFPLIYMYESQSRCIFRYSSKYTLVFLCEI